jgi:hypothetical protein
MDILGRSRRPTIFKTCKDNDEKIEKALLEVKDLGARKLHYG